jgi:hypothetical protein
VLMPANSRLRDTRSKKIILNWTGPMIVYELDGRGNAILQRLDGKLLCNIVSLRRLKPAYIRTKEGKLLTTREDVLQQLDSVNDMFTRELKVGLLSDYLAFEDAEGQSYTEKGSQMAMVTEPDRDDIFELHVPEPAVSLSSITQKELLNHMELLRDNPYNAGEFTVVRARFIKGILNFLVRRSDAHTKRSFYIPCTESVGYEHLLDAVIRKEIPVTGRPCRPE